MDFALWVYTKINGVPLKLGEEELRAMPKESILIFSNTALGDTVLSTPALKSLRDSFPNSRISLFIHKNIYPLIEGAEFIDNFVVYQGGYRNFFSSFMQLRHIKPDIALLLHSNGPQDIVMAVMSGAKVVLKTPTRSSYKNFLSYEFVKKSQHTIEDRLDLVRTIGAETLTTQMLLPSRYYRGEERKIFEQNQRVIGFQPGAANLYKMWPIEKFKELAKTLLEEPNTVIAVSGSVREKKLGDAIKEVDEKRIVNFCGKFAVETLPKLISEMDLLVTNDTGTMHIAIALGVPTVELFGATESAGIGAYQDGQIHKIIQAPPQPKNELVKKSKRENEIMRTIETKEVFDAVQTLLKAEVGV